MYALFLQQGCWKLVKKVLKRKKKKSEKEGSGEWHYERLKRSGERQSESEMEKFWLCQGMHGALRQKEEGLKEEWGCCGRISCKGQKFQKWQSSREWVGKDSQQTYIPGEGICLETYLAIHTIFPFFFFFLLHTHTKPNTLCTHNNFIQSTHVNKNMQLIPHITTLPENILSMLFLKSIFSQKVMPTKVILKHLTLKLFSIGILYGQWAEKDSFKRKLRAKA